MVFLQTEHRGPGLYFNRWNQKHHSFIPWHSQANTHPTTQICPCTDQNWVRFVSIWTVSRLVISLRGKRTIRELQSLMGSFFSNPVSKDTNLTQTYFLYVHTSIVLSAVNNSLISNRKTPGIPMTLNSVRDFRTSSWIQKGWLVNKKRECRCHSEKQVYCKLNSYNKSVESLHVAKYNLKML